MMVQYKVFVAGGFESNIGVGLFSGVGEIDHPQASERVSETLEDDSVVFVDSDFGGIKMDATAIVC